jgi:hypothetical protein
MSSLAVFLVLGGATAFAASQLGKNSVGSAQLKRNAVTTAKIKRNAVTGAKIKKGAITGAKIKLKTLGTVPSAATFTGYSRKGIVRAAPTNGATVDTAREAAPEIPLFTAGAFSIYAKCLSFGTTVRGEVLIKTTANGSIFSGENEELAGQPYLNTTTPEKERVISEEQAGANLGEMLAGEDETAFYAMAPDGTSVKGDGLIAVKNGSPTGGDGVYGAGNVCLFSGDLIKLN